MVASLIAFGGIIFWLILAAYVIAVILCIESDGKSILSWPITLTLVLAGLFYLMYRAPLAERFGGFTLGGALSVFGLYLVAGIVWSFFKWFKFLKNAKKKYDKEVLRVEDVNKDKKAKGQDKYCIPPPNIEYYIPLASENKEQLSCWILFWPFSGLRYMMGNLLVDLLHAITDAFAGTYNKISYKIFGYTPAAQQKD